VELGSAAPVDGLGGLQRRAHGRPGLDRLTQELDVWSRTYPVALAAPALEPAEIGATVEALRDVLAAGVTKRAVLAVPPAGVERAVPLVESALAQGPDIDIELVPTDAPATLLSEPWLAVVPRGSTWHDSRALAVWTFDVAASGAGGPPGKQATEAVPRPEAAEASPAQ
jgi:hypothetical protein